MKIKIKNFEQFINEEISGTELVGPVGPAYGETRTQNKTVSYHDTKVIYCDLDSKFYTIDDYNNIYQNYLKNGGSPLEGISLDNIVSILEYK